MPVELSTIFFTSFCAFSFNVEISLITDNGNNESGTPLYKSAFSGCLTLTIAFFGGA